MKRMVLAEGVWEVQKWAIEPDGIRCKGTLGKPGEFGDGVLLDLDGKKGRLVFEEDDGQ